MIFEAVSFVCRLVIPFFPFALNDSGKNVVFSLLNSENWLLFWPAAIVSVLALIWMFSWVIWPFSVALRPFTNSLFPRVIFVLNQICRRVRLLQVVFKPMHIWLMRIMGRPRSNRVILVKKFVKIGRSGFDKAFQRPNHGSRFLLFLTVSCILVGLVTAYPYFPDLNPFGKFVATDVAHYYEPKLIELDSLGNMNGVISGVFQSSTGDRPLSLLMLFFGWKITGVSVGQALVLSEVMIGLLLVLATYFFVRFAGFNRFYASLATLFVAVSPHVTVGLYGGLLANMIGLVFFYLFWGLVLACLKTRSWRLCFLAALFQSLLLFSHANTWDMSIGILAFLFLILLLEWLINRKSYIGPLMLLVISVFGVSMNFARNWALNMRIGTVEAVGVARSGVSSANLLGLWQTLGVSLGSYMGIAFMNPVLFFFAAVGGLFVAFDGRLLSRFLTACLAATSLPFILGDKVVQTRIMYDLPIPVFAFLGLLVSLGFVEKLFKSDESRRIRFLLILLIVLVEVNYAIYCSFYLTQLNLFPAR